MYRIYADNQLIYSPDMVENGYFVSQPTCEKEVNKSGSCQFYIYKQNPYYNAIKPLKTIISVKDGSKEVWRGRVLNAESNFDNRKTVYCEGILSFLVDSVIRPYDRNCNMEDQFRYLIAQHNEQVESFKQFTIKSITVDDPYGSKQWKTDSYEKTKDAIDGILNTYGGYLIAEYENGQNVISYVKDPAIYSTQTIEFGRNLLDLTITINPDNVFTALIPIGYDGNHNKITIESVNDNKDYIVSSEGVDEYGLIFFYHVFDETVSSATELKEKGEVFLAKNIKASKTLNLKAVDLHMIDPTIQAIDLYDLIKVISSPHGVNEYEMCTKVTLNLESPESSEFIIGTVPTGITDLKTT